MEQNEKKSLKSRAIAALIWKLLENGGTQGILFVVTIVLARLLNPAEYGVLSITVIFVTIAGVFVQRGFSMSLVQKKDADDLDFNSVFWFTLLVAFLLYAALFFAAPFIESYYNTPRVAAVLRTVAVILFAGAVTSVQSAIIMRELAFRKRFVTSVISVVLSGTVGIVMAYMGFGVWALVGQQLTDNFTMCIGLSIATGWRPRLKMSFQRLKGLFAFGWKLLVSSLLETVYSDLSGLIIGKRYSTTDLAQYDRGRKFPQYLGTNLSGAIQSTLFPTFAIAQDDQTRLHDMLRKSMAASAFLMFPLMAGMAAVASPLVYLVLTEKWMPSVPFMQIFCITFAMYPVDATVLQAINALGRSDLYLKLEVAKKLFGIAFIAVAVFWLDTPLSLAWALAATAVVSVVLNAIPIKRLIHYTYVEQCKDLLPSLGLSFMMGTVVFAVTYLNLGPWGTLLTQVALGVAVYAGCAALFKMKSFYYILNSARELLGKKRRKGTNAEEKLS